MVEASAIGLGATAVCKIICTCIGDNSDGLIVFIFVNLLPAGKTFPLTSPKPSYSVFSEKPLIMMVS